ncbi:ABC transporter permease [Hydrogenoanaerobacterium sp.]|uniref:ABC transporter permease n=1 Tax=Hydrogenoanaerobacterium sp. TaxID=2953763 RepID=UPI0028A15F8B|nr:ABC transporter permease [Hydrogenoanaerobacterium sp.]
MSNKEKNIMPSVNRRWDKQILKSDGFSSFASSLMAIVVGLLVGFIVLLVSNPSQALGGFKAILMGGFVDMKNLGQVFYFATPIIMTGLSVGFANRTGLFNIGASGQFIIGAYAAVYVGVKWTFLPGASHWIVALIVAMLAGAIWGLIPGILNAMCNVNVVISCIMMNYVGMYTVNFLVTKTIFDSLKNQSKPVAATAIMPKMGLNQLFKTGNSSSSVNAGIFVAIIAGIVIYIILNKTKFGFELKACGFNRDACKYAGINEKRNIMYSMMIAGALAALGGALLYLAGSGKGIEVLDTLAAEGFNGIPVALLGLNNPIGIIFSGIFVAYLNVGGFNMQLYDFVPQVIEIIISVIIYFSAFAFLLKGFIQSYNKKRDDHAANANAEPDLNTTTEKGGEE